MLFSWLLNLINKSNSVSIDPNKFVERQQFLDVVEKNSTLEHELATKKEQVNKTHKNVLTILQIWKTMNTSEHLSDVINAIISGLSDDLGYIYCLIFQITENENGKKLKIRDSSENKCSNIFREVFGDNINNYGIPVENKGNILIDSIRNQEVRFVTKLSDIFSGIEPKIENHQLLRLDSLFYERATAILPLVVRNRPFGCLVVISAKKEISDIENSFLKLFAGQIELSVSMMGMLEMIKAQAITDGLTKLYNRRHFDQCLVTEVNRAKRMQQPFTLIILDLDHLKEINDTYGHSAGDSAISAVAHVLLQNARTTDIPARFGGEEFVVVLPGVDTEGGLAFAERLRTAVEARVVEGVGSITVSIGVATFLNHTDRLEELFELVDQALYRAKKNGRNRVEEATKYLEFNWEQIGLELFIDILSNRNLPIDEDIANDLIHKIEVGLSESKNLSELLYNTIYMFIKNYDPYYPKGLIKTKIALIGKIADEMNLPKLELDRIKLATVLCDIGNIMLLKDILLKSSPLSEEEKKRIHEHPSLIAKEMLKPIKRTIISSIISMVVHHHEHWDGSGYPYNLSKEEIPIGSRIIAIVNAYTALISKRPYRKAYYHEEAIDIMESECNKVWDPELFHILKKFRILKENAASTAGKE